MSAGKRFGGTFSPGGPPREGAAAAPRQTARPASRRPWAGRAATSVSLRTVGLFVFPTPLLLGALWSLMTVDVLRFGGFLVAYAALILGAGLTREGLRAEAAFNARTVARPPTWPRKLFGAALTALGVGGAVWLGGGGVAGAAGFAVAAATLHVIAFGPDPMKAKGLSGLSGAALDDAVTRIETARRLVAEMTAAANRFADAALRGRVDAVAESALGVIERLERNPGDLRRSRRFLAVYLVGARDAAVSFAQAWAEDPDPAIAQRYAALLGDMQTQFDRHAEVLGESDKAALDVEIEVLQDRLKLEGV